MLSHKLFSFTTILMISAFLGACGGSGSGGASPSGTVIPQSAAKAVLTALGQSRILTGVDKPPISISSPSVKGESTDQISDAKQIQRALRHLKSLLGQKQFQKIEEENLPCDSGTAVKTVNDNDTPLDLFDDFISTQYNNCLTMDDTMTTLVRGMISLSISRSASGIRISQTFTDLVTRETKIITGAFTESLRNGNTLFSISPQSASVCGDEIFYKNLRVISNVSTTGRKDTNGDETLEHEDLVQLNNWTLDVSETHSAAPGCKIISTDLTLNGGISKSHVTHPGDDYNIGFSDLVMRLDTKAEPIPGSSATILGEEVSLSGLVAVRSPCSFGSFTVSTPSRDIPFFPSGGRCAIRGRYIVSTGDSVHSIISNRSGGVLIDEGNNGDIEQRFSSCDIAGTCTTAFLKPVPKTNTPAKITRDGL